MRLYQCNYRVGRRPPSSYYAKRNFDQTKLNNQRFKKLSLVEMPHGQRVAARPMARQDNVARIVAGLVAGMFIGLIAWALTEY